jgi:Flp pilus assembly protein TadG
VKLSRLKFGRGPISHIRPAIWRRQLQDEEGQTIVETAMSIIILLTFMFGVFEAGLAIYSYHFISEAAREGTRYAIVRGSSAGTTACTAPGPPTCIAQGGSNTGDIATYVKYLGFPGINPGNMTVNSSWSAYANGSSCPASPSPCNSPGNLVTIVVTYNFPLTVTFVPKKTYAMSSTAAMIIQN